MARPQKTLNLDEALTAAKSAALAGREILTRHFGHLSQVTHKVSAGLVSEADVESEKAIIETLTAWCPEISVLGEESSYQKNVSEPAQRPELSPYHARWIVDPLDGTTNYVHSFPIFCISMALEVKGQVALGLVDVPMLHQTFWAIKDRGAFCNDTPIRVSERKQLADALLATGFFAEDKNILKKQVAAFCNLIDKTRGIRRAGSAAFDLCMVAAGVFDGFWESHLKPWDTAAGFLLVTEAGGRVSDYSGQEYNIQMPEILATNGPLHDQCLKILKSIP